MCVCVCVFVACDRLCLYSSAEFVQVKKSACCNVCVCVCVGVGVGVGVCLCVCVMQQMCVEKQDLASCQKKEYTLT